ncbi:MAG: hypothetical protein PHF86_11315 [Candidatus Nanoarchaeia archaeon]|nr:hypothetical protein [Candidatus Nanoarchaeia archaeon]
MNKRGIANHIDWIIGISIFLLYIVFVIITLKPGVQPLNEGTVLLNMIQDNFISDVSWSITKIPLKVNICPSSGITGIKIPFPFSDLSSNKLNVIDKSTGNIVSSDLDGTNLFISTSETASVEKSYDLFLSSESFFNEYSNSQNNYCLPTIYIYGVSETLTGISEDKLNVLKTKASSSYEQLKTDWKHYPTTSDFSITINDGSEEKIIDKNPPENTNVYVRQLVEFILNSKGEKVPVTVTIKAW